MVWLLINSLIIAGWLFFISPNNNWLIIVFIALVSLELHLLFKLVNIPNSFSKRFLRVHLPLIMAALLFLLWLQILTLPILGYLLVLMLILEFILRQL